MKNFWKNFVALFKKSDTEKTALQKTARASVILVCVALVGLIVYFAAIAPLLRAGEEYVPELFEGEVYQNKALYILRQHERSEIESIEIKNGNEHYKLVADEKGDFHIEGSETIPLAYDSLSLLLADVRVLVANSPAGQERVTTTATEQDLRNYGLDAASDPSWFEVSLYNGSSYRLYIGNALVTTTGYYVMLDGRKNVVTDDNGVTTEYDIIYALRSGLSSTVLAESASLVSTEIAPYYGSAIYETTNFALLRRNAAGEKTLVVRIGLVNEAEGLSTTSTQVYKMIYPSAYNVDEDTYGKVLNTLAYVTADAIVAYGDAIYQPEVYEKYGLDLDIDRLDAATDNNYITLLYNCATTDSENYDDLATLLYFSEKFTDLDGVSYYYVYSPDYAVIAKVSASTFAYLEFGVTSFTSPRMYYDYFTSTEYIEIISGRDGLDLRFTLSGKERTRHVDVTSSGDNGGIIYCETAAGGRIPLVYDVIYRRTASGQLQYEGNFEIFRDLYYTLITRDLALYATIDESMTTVDDAPARIVRVKSSPKDHPMSYYRYNANGTTAEMLRDQGGNIFCEEVTIETTLSDGTPTTLTYDRAFYDEAAGRFFLKRTDSNDGNEKPNGFENDGDGCVKVTTYLPNTAVGKYTETIYEYEIYDLYDEYTDVDGKTVRQLNATYAYIVPTITTNTYRLSSGGARELLETHTERADVGVYIRTATIDKLFSDTLKLLAGEKIDTWGIN